MDKLYFHFFFQDPYTTAQQSILSTSVLNLDTTYCCITTEVIYLLEAADLSVADHTVTNILQDVGEIAQESVNE